jgi:magnesium chelatase family protein
MPGYGPPMDVPPAPPPAGDPRAPGQPVGRTRTVALVGLDPAPVTVEAHVGGGLPGLHVLGASGVAAREAGERVRTALLAAGVTMPQSKILVSLAPADVPKGGARFDLAIAAAFLAQRQVVPAAAVADSALLGELALDGGLRPVSGVLPSAAALPAMGCRRLFVAEANAAEATLVDAVDVVPLASLRELVEVLSGRQPPRRPGAPPAVPSRRGPDLADVRGQAEARRALELAAAGGHHLLLVGPPGCGKSMLAARLPGLLPPLDQGAALELAGIRSVAGLLRDGALLDDRPPFQAPHHGSTVVALMGGGSGIGRPGAISLATHGVLFLDELFEWPRSVLEALREPLEEGVVRIARARGTVVYPARVQLVCAANPCPCGGGERCACTEEAIWSYRSKLSGPLADRLDLAPAVERLRATDLLVTAGGEGTAAVRERVIAARARARARWGRVARCNAVAPPPAVRDTAEAAALTILADAVERGAITGRGFDRALRVARTIADLDGSDRIHREHVYEALAHRLQLRAPGPVSDAAAAR